MLKLIMEQKKVNPVGRDACLFSSLSVLIKSKYLKFFYQLASYRQAKYLAIL